MLKISSCYYETFQKRECGEFSPLAGNVRKAGKISPLKNVLFVITTFQKFFLLRELLGRQEKYCL
jgi:hypothetical protein